MRGSVLTETSHRRRWRRITLALAVGLVLPMALIGLALTWKAVDPGTLSGRLDAARPWLGLWRLALVGALVGAWGPLSVWLGRMRGLTGPQVAALKQHRWTVAIVLLAVELVLVQNIFGLLWGR